MIYSMLWNSPKGLLPWRHNQCDWSSSMLSHHASGDTASSVQWTGYYGDLQPCFDSILRAEIDHGGCPPGNWKWFFLNSILMFIEITLTVFRSGNRAQGFEGMLHAYRFSGVWVMCCILPIAWCVYHFFRRLVIVKLTYLIHLNITFMRNLKLNYLRIGGIDMHCFGWIICVFLGKIISI
jgi:hypothetical protein